MLRLALGVAAAAAAAAQKCGTTPQLRYRRGRFQIASREEKLVVLAAPKGGATLAAKVALEHFNRTAAWRAHNAWVHKYLPGFRREPDHRDVNVQQVARHDPDWIVLFFVRNPLDRVVSSYGHVMRVSSIQWLVRDTAPRTSFSDFLDALERNFPGNDRTGEHAAPQSRNLQPDAKVTYLPVETLDRGLLDALPRLHPRIRPALRYDKNGTGASGHYVTQATAARVDVAAVPWTNLTGSDRFPNYGDFVLDPGVRAKVLCLFALDVDLYRRACGQPWIERLCPACAVECAVQVARLDNDD